MDCTFTLSAQLSSSLQSELSGYLPHTCTKCDSSITAQPVSSQRAARRRKAAGKSKPSLTSRLSMLL